MPALPPYVPPQQAKFTAWLANFSALITAAPATYGLLASDAVTIAGYNASWVAAYTVITSGSTRTPAAVSAKNTALATILPPIRVYAQAIANNPGVASAAKIAVGVNPKTSTPSPVTAPASNPVLVLQSGSPGQVILRYRDSAASVSVKAKPYGVVHCQIVGKTSAAPVTDPTTLPVIAVATKSPYTLTTAALASGSTLYLSAYWLTRKGLKSPPAPIIAVTVP